MVKSIYVPEAGGILNFADDVTPEQARAYIDKNYPRGTGGVASLQPESDNSSFLDRAAYSFGTMFTDIPGGIASLMYPASREDETWGGRFSKYWREQGAKNTNIDLTKTPTTTQNLGSAFGSIVGFAVPGGLATKGASALGAGARLAAGVGRGVVAGQGAAVGAEQRSEQIRQQIASGMDISEEKQLAAQRLSALIGTSEVIPLQKFFGPISTILSKVPASKAGIVEKIIQNRLAKVTKAGLEEGAQEVLSGIANDLMEYGVYNPDVEIGQDIWTNAGTGAFAGSLLEGMVQIAAGRKLRASRQLKADLQAEAQQNSVELNRAEIATNADILAQSGVEGEVTIEPNEGPDGQPRFTVLSKGVPVINTMDQQSAIEAINLHQKNTGVKISVNALEVPTLDPIQIGNKRFATIEAAQVERARLKKKVQDLRVLGDNIELISKMAAKDNVAPATFSKRIEDNIRTSSAQLAMFDKYFTLPDVETPPGPKVETPEDKTAEAIPVEEITADEAGVAEEVAAEEAPKKTVRVYHSGSAGEGETGRWVSTDKTYAENYRPDLPLYSTEIPADDPRINPDEFNPEQSVDNGFTFNFELTPEEATSLQEVKRDTPEPITSEEDVPPIGAVEMPIEESRVLPDEIVDNVSGPDPVQDVSPAPVKIEQRPSATVEDLDALKTQLFGRVMSVREMTPEQLAQYEAERDRRFPPKDVDVYYSAGQVNPKPTMTIREAHVLGPSIPKTPEAQKWMGDVYKKLQQRLDNILPEGAKLELRTLIESPDPGYLMRGSHDTVDTQYGLKSVIDLSTGVLEPGMSVEDAVNKLVDTLNHELLHALKAQGLFRANEWRMLEKAVANNNIPGKKYTYLDKAQAIYGRDTNELSPAYKKPEVIVEEAIADMYRDWVRNQKAPVPVRGLLNRITEFFRRIFQTLRNNQIDTLFKDVEAGNVGKRTAVIETPRTDSDGDTKFSAAPALGSEEFKKWWGESKAVNEDGTPRVFYHGTGRSFSNFGKARSGAFGLEDQGGPFFFSPSARFANDYATMKLHKGGHGAPMKTGGRMIPVYLSVQNPFDFTNPDHVKKMALKMAEERSLDGERAVKFANDFVGYLQDGDWNQMERSDVQRAIRASGFDGFYLVENGFKNLAVYKPEQVKSIFNKFEDGAATSKKFSAAPAMDSKEFKEWWGDSKITDKFGAPKVVYHGSKNFVGDEFTGDVERANRDGNIEGFYFTEVKSRANGYTEDWRNPGVPQAGAQVIPVYLSIQNPFIKGKSRPNEAMAEVYRKELVRLNSHLTEGSDWFDQKVKEMFARGDISANALGGDGKAQQDVYKAGGFDGVINGTEITAFEPTQIKSIFNKFEAGAAKSKKFSAAPLPTYVQTQNQTLFAPVEKTPFASIAFNHFFGRNLAGKTLNVNGTAVEVKGRTMAGLAARAATVDSAAYLNHLESILNQQNTGNFQRDVADYSASAAISMQRRSSQLHAAMLLRGNIDLDYASPGDILSATAKVVDDQDNLKNVFNILLEPGPVDQNGVQKDKLEIFKTYATAKRGEWLRSTGQTVPREITPQYVRETVSFTEREYPEVVEAYKMYQRFNKKLLTTADKAGILKPGELARLTNQMNYYGFIYEAYGEALGPQTAGKLASRFKLRPYTGTVRGGLVNDPMFVILQNTQFWVDSIAKNLAATKAFNVARQVGEARLLGASEKPNEANGEQPDVMFFSENGVVKRFAVKDPLLVTALGSDDRIAVGKFWETLGLPAHILRESVTRDPGFMVRNLMRDTLSAWITSGVDFTPVIGTIKGAKTALRDGASFKALQARGAVGSYDMAMLSTEDLAKLLKQKLPKNVHGITSVKQGSAVVKSLWNRLGAVSEASDAATRIAVYEALKAKGMSDAEATMQAIELLDFTRRGASQTMSILTKIIPFLNARVQGMDVLYQAGRSGWRYATGGTRGERDANVGKQFLIRGGILLAISVALEIMNEDDEDYKQIDDYVKNGNLLVPLKHFGLEGQFLAFPKPFEAGLLFSTIPQQIYKTTQGDASTRENASLFFSQMTSTFGINPIPQAILPMIEVISNHDFFTGLPLIPEGKARLAPELQYNTSTSQLAMMIGKIPIFYNFDTGKFGGASPIVIDKLIRGYSGPVGSYFSQGVGLAMQDLDIGPERMPTELSNAPVIRSFFVDAKSKNPKVVTQAYELFRVVDEVNRSVSRMKQLGDTEALLAYVDENRDILTYKKTIFKLADSLNKLSAQERRIERDSTMSAEEKVAAQRQLREIRIKVASQVEAINKALGR